MPTFSLTSMQRLSSCDIRLQLIVGKLIEHIDCTVICGHRNKAEQDKAVADGNSQKAYPSSLHNKLPSKAVDLAPYYPEAPHIRWEDREGFTYLAGIVKGIATSMGYKIRWGGDWDSDNDLKDEKFRDLPHFEVLD